MLKPGARFCAMVFAGPEDNPCIRILMTTALRHAGLPPRDPFAPGGLMSLGRPGRVENLFRDAGLRDVVTTRLDAPFRLASVEEYMAFVRAAAAPVRAVLAGLGPDAQATAWNEMTEQLRAFDRNGGWEGPNTLLLTVGQR